MKTRVGIVGATGYSGQELIKILSSHNEVEITYVSSRAEKGTPVINYYPFLKKELSKLLFSDVNIDEASEKCDFIFCATPSGIAKDIAPIFYKKGLKVIDVSGDFRLSNSMDYKKWYNYDHPYPDLLNEIVYSIPELNRYDAKGSDFISNPGCYPTSVLLGLIPVLSQIDVNDIIIDSKSGVTGAGKKMNQGLMFSEVNESFHAYKVGGAHQHTPEIEKYISEWTDKDKKVIFTPHLLPMNRGILSTIYLPGISVENYERGKKALKSKYENEYFIKYLENSLPKTKDVAFTNQCHLTSIYDDRSSTMLIISVIDNLVRGASGQAVQNMNLMLNIDERVGLC